MSTPRKTPLDVPSPSEVDQLRRDAEQRFAEKVDTLPEPDDLDGVLHELRVHQIELEMQNEELRSAQLKLDEQNDKYLQLFYRAPVACLAIGVDGIVDDANLAAARLLGIERELLQGRPVIAFVAPEDRDEYHLHQRELERSGEPQSFEVRLCRGAAGENDVVSFWALVESQHTHPAESGTPATWVTFTDISERRRESEALQESEERYRSVVAALHEGVILQGADGKIIAYNDAAAEVFGLGSTDAVGETSTSRDWGTYREDGTQLPGEEHPSMITLRTGEPCSDVLVGVRGPMGHRWIVVSSEPMRHSGEAEPYAVVISFVEITDRKQIEDELRESERWLLESQRIARLGHYVFEIDEDRWTGSLALYDVLGVGEEDNSGNFDSWLSIVHPGDRERLSRYFTEEVLKKHAPFDIEYRIVRPSDGVERWVHGLGTVEYRDDGGPRRMFGTIQDTTQRKLLEAAADSERAMLKQAEAVGQVGSWRVALVGRDTEWSAETARILGVDPAAEGDPLAAIRRVVHPDDAEYFAQAGMQGLMRSDTRSLEFRVLRPNGEVRWVIAQAAVQKGEDGEPVAVTGILQDVTDRKLIEEERVSLLEQAANIDRLTGLHNLRGFDLIVGQVMAQAQRAEQGIGLIFCDMDDLKGINDQFGHAQGDRALQDAASVLKFTLRNADAIARIGGDEFIVLSVGGDRDSVLHLERRLQEGYDFFNATTDRPYRISLSSGTAYCEPLEPCEFDELKADADRNMYEEKMKRRRAT